MNMTSQQLLPGLVCSFCATVVFCSRLAFSFCWLCIVVCTTFLYKFVFSGSPLFANSFSMLEDSFVPPASLVILLLLLFFLSCQVFWFKRNSAVVVFLCPCRCYLPWTRLCCSMRECEQEACRAPIPLRTSLLTTTVVTSALSSSTMTLHRLGF